MQVRLLLRAYTRIAENTTMFVMSGLEEETDGRACSHAHGRYCSIANAFVTLVTSPQLWRHQY